MNIFGFNLTEAILVIEYITVMNTVACSGSHIPQWFSGRGVVQLRMLGGSYGFFFSNGTQLSLRLVNCRKKMVLKKTGCL